MRSARPPTGAAREKNPQLQRVYGTAWPTKDELKAYLDRLAEAERRDHRKLGAELDLFSFPDELGSGLAVFHPKGGVIKREMEDYVRRRHIEEGFDYVGTPHITKDGLFHTSGHLPYYADTHVPADGARGRGVLPQGDELPDAQPHLPLARAVLPRAAAAAVRVRLGLPVREVGRRPRPDPGARHDPGRLALLRHRRAGARRDQAPARLRASACCATSASTTSTSSCRPRDEATTRTSSSAPTSSGRSPPRVLRGGRAASPASSSCPTRVAPRSTARRSRCRRATRSAAPGRCRPSSTTSTSPSGSAWSTRRPTARGSSPVMIHSAKFGSIERFLGVLVEHYAGAFPAWLSPVQVLGIPVAEEYADYLQDVLGPAAAQGDPRRARRQRRPVPEEDPQREQVQGARSCSSPARRTARPARCRSATATASQKNGVPVDDAIAEIVAAVEARVQV